MIFACILVYFTKLGVLEYSGHAGYGAAAFCELVFELIILAKAVL